MAGADAAGRVGRASEEVGSEEGGVGAIASGFEQPVARVSTTATDRIARGRWAMAGVGVMGVRCGERVE